jgi:hypothetical protein
MNKMAGVIENDSKVGQILSRRKSQSEIHRRLVSVYGQKAFSWREEFMFRGAVNV